MFRKKMKKRFSKKVFKKGLGVHKKNIKGHQSRGGIRL